jgi:hypothetical protein
MSSSTTRAETQVPENPSAEKTLSAVNSKINTLVSTEGNQGQIQLFGVTSKATFVPSKRIDIIKSATREQQCDNQVAAQSGELDEVQITQLRDSDAGAQSIHPIFSKHLQSRQAVSFFERTGRIPQIEQTDLGFSPVQVLTHSVRWNTDSSDPDKNASDTYLTRFQRLAELSETSEMNPLDILGLAVTAFNEMRKP